MSGVAGHKARKDKVDRVAHLGAASKILVKNYSCGILRCSIIKPRKAFLAVDKYLRLCLTEAVNTLLDVAHGEQVLLVARNAVEDKVLHVVYILIFVYDDRVVAA